LAAIRRRQLGQEAARLLLAVGTADAGRRHRGDHEPALGTGGGHVEQAAFLVEQSGGLAHHRGRTRPGASGQDVDQAFGAQQAAAQAQVGPDALLDPGKHDHVPLQALRGVCGQQTDGLAPVGARGDRVGGQVLAEDVVQEDLGARTGEPVDEPGGRVEEHHHGVQVAVGRLGAPLPCATAFAAGLDRGATGAQGVPPVGQAAGPPDRPQHLLGGGSRSGGGRACGGDQVGDGLRGQRPAPIDHVQSGRVAHRVDQQLARRPAIARRQGQCPQPLPQPPLGERVGTAQRRVQQRDGGFLIQGVRLERAAQQQQERGDRGLQVQGQILGVHHRRHAGRGQRTLQRRRLQRGRTQHHGHPRPGHPVQQMGFPQRVRDEGGLTGRRPEGSHHRARAQPVGGHRRPGGSLRPRPVGPRRAPVARVGTESRPLGARTI
jgi:hypothetical protein